MSEVPKDERKPRIWCGRTPKHDDEDEAASWSLRSLVAVVCFEALFFDGDGAGADTLCRDGSVRQQWESEEWQVSFETDSPLLVLKHRNKQLHGRSTSNGRESRPRDSAHLVESPIRKALWERTGLKTTRRKREGQISVMAGPQRQKIGPDLHQRVLRRRCKSSSLVVRAIGRVLSKLPCHQHQVHLIVRWERRYRDA